MIGAGCQMRAFRPLKDRAAGACHDNIKRCLFRFHHAIAIVIMADPVPGASSKCAGQQGFAISGQAGQNDIPRRGQRNLTITGLQAFHRKRTGPGGSQGQITRTGDIRGNLVNIKPVKRRPFNAGQCQAGSGESAVCELLNIGAGFQRHISGTHLTKSDPPQRFIAAVTRPCGSIRRCQTQTRRRGQARFNIMGHQIARNA